MVVGGLPRFQYNGYWLVAVDPWPQQWGNDWYDNDQVYVDYVDGGYYVRTRENRPLIGPAGPEGVFVSCAYSGFGIMASAGSGDLVARHIMEAPLPRYAPAFLLSRYDDVRYRAALETWGDGGQL